MFKGIILVLERDLGGVIERWLPSSFVYVRIMVLSIFNNLVWVFISDHFKAHSSPMRIPVWMHKGFQSFYSLFQIGGDWSMLFDVLFKNLDRPRRMVWKLNIDFERKCEFKYLNNVFGIFKRYATFSIFTTIFKLFEESFPEEYHCSNLQSDNCQVMAVCDCESHYNNLCKCCI